MIDKRKFEYYIRALNYVKDFHNEMRQIIAEGEDALKGLSKFSYVTKETDILDCNVSTRLYNILVGKCPLFEKDRAKTKTSVLENLSVKEFLSYENSGKSTLKELQELCYCAGISMKP